MLTPRQLQCYNAIKAYIAKNGYAPSYQEIADLIGQKSKNSIHRLILGMEERGALERIPNRNRAIRLLPLN